MHIIIIIYLLVLVLSQMINLMISFHSLVTSSIVSDNLKMSVLTKYDLMLLFSVKELFFYNFDILNNDHVSDSQLYIFDYLYVRLEMFIIKTIIRIRKP